MKSTWFARCLLVLLAGVMSTATAQDFSDARCDSSPEAVARDEISLRETIREALEFLLAPPDGDVGEEPTRDPLGLGSGGFDAADTAAEVERIASRIEIEYAGPARFVPIPSADELQNRPTIREPDVAGAAAEPITEWLGVNPVTCNQFRMGIPTETSEVIAEMATGKDLDKASSQDDVVKTFPPWDWTPPDPEPEPEFCPANTGPYFSGCVDSRLRFPTTDYPNRTIASFSKDGQGSSCTGTFVGPRHVITAGHCVYQGNNIWHDFWVIPGRNGTQKPYGSTLMSDTQGSGFRWYWIPAAVVGSYPNWYTGLDIAILIVPQRLGDQTGWMGVGARSENALSQSWTRNRGYPAQPGAHTGFHCSQVEGALYGDINICNVGNFEHYDPQGWARLASHSCDNTSGHSGSPIFEWVWDSSLQASVPIVSLIVSHHAAFVNDFDCANNPRPYQATRITPEYANQFLFMRSWKP